MTDVVEQPGIMHCGNGVVRHVGTLRLFPKQLIIEGPLSMYGSVHVTLASVWPSFITAEENSVDNGVKEVLLVSITSTLPLEISGN